jgi:benzoylformate decarboxylase
MRSVREATYEVMRELGMTTIFGNPGSTELPFLRNLPVDFKYVLALHERSAAGMGVGYAMARGKAAFVNLHSVASVGNGLAAIVDAHYCHAPLVVTAGQQDRRQIQSEPFLASRSRRCSEALRQMGVGTGTRGGRSRCDCARILSRDAAADGASIHFHSHG